MSLKCKVGICQGIRNEGVQSETRNRKKHDIAMEKEKNKTSQLDFQREQLAAWKEVQLAQAKSAESKAAADATQANAFTKWLESLKK
jgi:hypothetical protein